MKQKSKAKNICLTLLFLLGLILTGHSFITTALFQRQSEETINEFQAALNELPPEREISSEEDTADTLPDRYTDLYLAMQDYNTRLYESGQEGLDGVESYETPAFNLGDYGINFESVGYISIPAMEVELPLYLGATTQNMSKGAVVLGQTSLPIGGENTNCVIAAHRGYRGIPYFREIELLQVGDIVEITTLWETLTYEVTGWQIVPSDSVDQILIQPEKDMVTLLTCHPYRVGTQRYLVFCEKKATVSDSLQPENSATDEEVYSASNRPSESVLTAPVADSSQNDINTEKTVQFIGLVLVFCAGLVLLLTNIAQFMKNWRAKK